MPAPDQSLEEVVAAVIDENDGRVGALMPVLHGIQERWGCIPDEAIPLISRRMNLSRAEVHGVMRFYHDFRSTPPGAHTVQICRAEACQAMGSEALERHAKQKLGIDYGQTTPDGRITLQAVYCLGNCACTPSVRIGDDVFARVTPARFDALLEGLANRSVDASPGSET